VRAGDFAETGRPREPTGSIPAQKLGRDRFTTGAAVLAYLKDEALRRNDPLKRRRGSKQP
jgi:hypothetical protein